MAKALELLSVEGQAFLDEIEQDRVHGLKEISDAYDSVLAALPVLRTEAEGLTPQGFQQWQTAPDATHPAWAELFTLTKEVAALEQNKPSSSEIKTKKNELKTLTKAAKDSAKARFRIVKSQIKGLEKLEKERDERIAEVNRRFSREKAEVNEAITDLQRICADPDEARRYFVVAEKGGIEENEFNLNVPRYVNTFEPEEEIELDGALAALAASEKNTCAKSGRLYGLLENR